LQRGDRVAVLLNNNVEAVEALAATAKPARSTPITPPLGARCGPCSAQRHQRAPGRCRYAGVVEQSARRPQLIVVRPGDPDSDYEALAGRAVRGRADRRRQRRR
jgi:hypothetical protein